MAVRVVVFAPLAHVTRNRVLFFSTIFFIVLAAIVHILPYTPPIWSLSSLSSLSSSSSASRCLHSLYSIEFFNEDYDDDNDDEEKRFRWAWKERSTAIATSACKFREFHRDEALELLSGTWIVVAGDSEARFLLLSLLELLLEDAQSIRSELFKFHGDFSHTIDEQRIQVDFFWAPYSANLTTKFQELHFDRDRNGSSKPRVPDVIAAGAGLWHMLHVTDPSDYAANLRVLAAAAMETAARSTKLFWLNLPVLVPDLLNTEAKREKLTAALAARYNEEMTRSNLTLPGGVFRVLDVKRLTALCGKICTSDGMHYVSAVYTALVQIMLQTLALIRNS